MKTNTYYGLFYHDVLDKVFINEHLERDCWQKMFLYDKCLGDDCFLKTDLKDFEGELQKYIDQRKEHGAKMKVIEINEIN